MKKTYIFIATFLVLFLTGIYFYQLRLETHDDQEYPAFVWKLIEKEKNGPVANPPASLSKCVYKNKTVYYLPPRCCDMPSTLYNELGLPICSPDGGMRGTGDGRCSDFSQETCQIIWQDSRSYP